MGYIARWRDKAEDGVGDCHWRGTLDGVLVAHARLMHGAYLGRSELSVARFELPYLASPAVVQRGQYRSLWGV